MLEVASGKTDAKNSAEQSLISSLLTVASALTSLAHRSGNVELSAKVKMSKSDLGRKSQAELAVTAEMLLGIAAEQQAQLAEYGIGEEKLAALRTSTTAFNEAIGKKESSLAERSAAHAALAELFRRNDALLRDDLDRLMELFRSDDADFYNAYWAARSIKNFGHRFRQTEEKPAEPEEPVV